MIKTSYIEYSLTIQI